MAMNPEAAGHSSMPPQGAYAPWDQAEAPRQAPVEWQVIEQVPGDPWTAELVVWAGEDIDGLVIPLDDSLMGAIADLRRRQADVAALDHDDPAVPTDGPGADPGAARGETSRVGSLLQGLGRSTGSSQADRWLAGVPVKFQIAGAVALLVVFVLVMLIGSLM
ncbi:hypothetical protein [Mariniluteicoccus flavus]